MMTNERPKTIGACCECGRGVIYAHHEEIECLVKTCHGLIYFFDEPVDSPSPEPVREWATMASARKYRLAWGIDTVFKALQ
jgi:hypothetical protein